MSLRAWLARLGPLFGLVGVFLFFLIAVWSKTGHNVFATSDNLRTIALQSAIVGMAALGMTMIIIAGGIDLSVGSTVALTSVTAAALMKFNGWPAFPARSRSGCSSPHRSTSPPGPALSLKLRPAREIQPPLPA